MLPEKVLFDNEIIKKIYNNFNFFQLTHASLSWGL